MSVTPQTMQQPKPGTVTRIATTDDLRQTGLAIIGCLNKIAAKQRELDAKLDRLLTILQTVTKGPPT